MKRFGTLVLTHVVRILAVRFVVVGVAILPSVAVAQPLVDSDPALEARVQQSLQLSSPAAFLTEAQSIQEEKPRFASDAWTTIVTPLRNQAKKMLLESNAVQTLSESQLNQILNLAGPSLTDVDKTTLRESINEQRDSVGQLDFEQMRSRLQTNNQLVDTSGHEGHVVLRELTAEWLKSQNMSALSNKQLRMCLGLTYPMLSASASGTEACRGLTAEWTGQITPSHSGETVFSISPIDVNEKAPGHSRRLTMQVWIDAQLVIDANPEEWKSEGEPVLLKQGEPVSVRVKIYYACLGERWIAKPIAASLYWEGAAGPRSIVPESAFVITNNDAAEPKSGLQASYHWEREGREIVESAVVPNLDTVIASNTICSYQDVLSSLVTEMLDRYIASDSLQTLSSEQEQASKNASPLSSGRLMRCLVLCTSAERAACLERILAQNDVVCSAKSLRLYEWARPGNPELALDLVGVSMQQGIRHSSYGPTVAGSAWEYTIGNRERYIGLAHALAWEYPPSSKQLEEQYLEMPDGGCCLPVARTISYVYLMQDNINAWIELLDSKLEDPSLTGDRRVSWLLARAQVEEIRRGRSGRFSTPMERILAGRAWLDEARLVAESAAESRSALKELFVRLIATGQWDSARELLAQETTKSGGQLKFASWHAHIDALELADEETQAQHKDEANQAYLAELERRRQQKVDSGSDASRYDALIEAATAE